MQRGDKDEKYDSNDDDEISVDKDDEMPTQKTVNVVNAKVISCIIDFDLYFDI